MKPTKLTITYLAVFLLTLGLDRLSKYYVLTHVSEPYSISSLLTCSLTFNRGISWNMFHSHDALVFCVVSIIVGFITALLAIYAIMRWRYGYHILGEVLVLSGAISNLIDRLIYGGVVDFIFFACGNLSFPIFNFADVFIVIGVGIMFIMNYKNL